MAMLTFEGLYYAVLIGFLPVLIWLVFWLFEDAKRPEPRHLIIRAFIAGMITVALVLPLQKLAMGYLEPGFWLILVWAAIEEILKLFVAFIAVLRHRAVNEPLDIPIYLITIALGFAALENVLFLIEPLTNGNILGGLITGNLRFVGATLIHTLSSAVIGGFLAFAFFKELPKKLLYGAFGIILAVTLHTIFNFSIINTSADYLLMVFAGVWVGIIFLLIAFERVKMLKRPAWWEKMFAPK